MTQIQILTIPTDEKFVEQKNTYSLCLVMALTDVHAVMWVRCPHDVHT